jgi:hypothetical protein
MLRLLLIALAILTASTPAQACRAYRSPGDRIAGLSEHPHFAGALLVRVKDARYTEPARPDYHPWQADAAIRRSGASLRTGIISFGRTGSSSACDDLTPVPKRGDLWVLYLSRSGDGKAVDVNLSYPLAVAKREDPRLAARLR